MAVSPHLATLARDGSLSYLADQDDSYYLALLKAPYNYGALALRDPYCGPNETVPVNYAWLQFAPLGVLTRMLGLPLILAGLVGRILGGCLLGGALYVLFRRLFAGLARPTGWSLGCALICLADVGFIEGRTFVSTLALPAYMIRGECPLSKADALPQYRLVSPLLNLPFALLLVSSFLPGTRPHFWRALEGTLAFAVCVLLYFYYWTAAALALGLYLVWQLGNAWWTPEHRGRSLRLAAMTAFVLLGGLLLGSPQIYWNWSTLTDPSLRPILTRIGLPLPVGHDFALTSQYIWNVWVWAKLFVASAALFLLGIQELGLLWCFTLAGYVLANGALLTGLEFQNFHWSMVHAPFGEILLLATAVFLLVRWCPSRGTWRHAAWSLPMILMVIGLFWRPFEALHATEAKEASRTLRKLEPLREALAGLAADRALAGPRVVNIANLFTRSYPLYGYYNWFSLLPEHSLHERHALNGWIINSGIHEYSNEIEQDISVNLSVYPGRAIERSRTRTVRLNLFSRLRDDPQFAAGLLDKYRVGYLLLPRNSPNPDRGGPWTLVQANEDWTLWSR
jgi:hypothetical protein